MDWWSRKACSSAFGLPSRNWLGDPATALPAITLVADASAMGLKRIAEAIQKPGGESAVKMRIVEQFLEEFGKVLAHAKISVVPGKIAELQSYFQGLSALTHSSDAVKKAWLRVVVRATGTRAHSARSWLGDNAIHRLAPVLDRLSAYRAREVDIDGCVYREGLSAVKIDGGVAGNVIPDAAAVTVNFRFAPDRSPQQALAHVQEVFEGLSVTIAQTDAAAGALPGLGQPAAAQLVAAAGGRVRAKYGWTDVSRFAALGIPALNYGPGDPNLAHTVDEHVEVAAITAVTETLRAYLSA